MKISLYTCFINLVFFLHFPRCPVVLYSSSAQLTTIFQSLFLIHSHTLGKERILLSFISFHSFFFLCLIFSVQIIFFCNIYSTCLDIKIGVIIFAYFFKAENKMVIQKALKYFNRVNNLNLDEWNSGKIYI